MFSLFFAVYSSPVDKDDDDDDYLQDKSDDYDEDDLVGDDFVEKSTTSVKPSEEPFNTQEYIQIADAGKSVTLQCKGDWTKTTLFIWYNGSVIVVQDKVVKPTENPRLSISKEDGSLTIKDVNVYDDVSFRCRGWPSKDRIETLVHVHVNGPPRDIRIGHNIKEQKNIIHKTLPYHAGTQNLRFKCSAKARPKAKIDWIHNGNTILQQGNDHDIKIEDEGVIIFKTLHAHHAGEYQCEASNELGTSKESFKIEVTCESLRDKTEEYFSYLFFLSFRCSFLQTSFKLFQR